MNQDRLPHHPSTIFEENEDEKSQNTNGKGVNPMQAPEIKPTEEPPKSPTETERPKRSRHESRSEEDSHQDTTRGRRRGLDRQSSEDQRAIDQYYDNNQYTVTGRYAKNEDTMNRIPKNFQRIIDGQKHGEPSVAARSRRSQRSIVPIPGANENRFLDSIYWVVQQHSLIGFRHLMMLVSLALLTMAGGFIFYWIEKDAERADLSGKLTALNSILNDMSKEFLVEMKKENNTLTHEELVKEKLRTAYKELLEAEGRWSLSHLRKKEDPEKNLWWSWWGGVFATTDVFMTVSYGVVPFYSNFGRGLLMVYGLLAIPLAVVVQRDLGQWQMTVCTKIYARILIRWRKARGIETQEDEEIELPVWLSILHMMGAWFLGAMFIYYYDAFFGPDGIGFWASFYCSYLTATTIGMGDMVPTNVTRDPTWKFFHFFVCMPSRVLNRCTYVAIEGSIFSFASKQEDRLSSLRQVKKVAPAKPEDVIASAQGQPAGRSFTQLIHDRQDVYGGDFGRVKVNKQHVE